MDLPPTELVFRVCSADLRSSPAVLCTSIHDRTDSKQERDRSMGPHGVGDWNGWFLRCKYVVHRNYLEHKSYHVVYEVRSTENVSMYGCTSPQEKWMLQMICIIHNALGR